MTEREALTSALAGPLVNARARSAGRRALRADARAGAAPSAASACRASPTARGCVAPTTAPTAERPCSPTRSAPHSATSSATWCHIGRPSESVTSCTSPPAFEVLTTQKMPGAVAARGGEVRLDRLAPEPRVDGERVGERLVALEVGGGVRARGRADVAALAVGDHEQAGARARRRRPRRTRPSLGAERLEERELRLDRDGVRRDRVDDPAAEARDVAAQLDRQAGRAAGRARRRAGCACARPPASRSANVSVATGIDEVERKRSQLVVGLDRGPTSSRSSCAAT